VTPSQSTSNVTACLETYRGAHGRKVEYSFLRGVARGMPERVGVLERGRLEAGNCVGASPFHRHGHKICSPGKARRVLRHYQSQGKPVLGRAVGVAKQDALYRITQRSEGFFARANFLPMAPEFQPDYVWGDLIRMGSQPRAPENRNKLRQRSVCITTACCNGKKNECLP
jgi:hypothetical protein